LDQRVKTAKSEPGSDSEVAESYIDVWGRPRSIDPGTRAALLNALGRRRKSPERFSIEQGRCHQPAYLENGGRVWGFMVQLYGVRSARNWGIGDFGDLRALVEIAAGLGAASVGVIRCMPAARVPTVPRAVMPSMCSTSTSKALRNIPAALPPGSSFHRRYFRPS